jgi:membrane protein YdbS with pleckstrin-like domain
MSSTQERTEPEETTLYQTKLHWAMLLGPALLMLVAGLSIPSKGLQAVILLAVSTIWGIVWTINLQTSEIKLTKNRILARIGFPWRRSYNIPYENIVRIDIYQPVLGKFLDFGRVIILLKGKGKKSLRMVHSPLNLAKSFSEYKQASVERQEQADIQNDHLQT